MGVRQRDVDRGGARSASEERGRDGETATRDGGGSRARRDERRRDVRDGGTRAGDGGRVGRSGIERVVRRRRGRGGAERGIRCHVGVRGRARGQGARRPR